MVILWVSYGAITILAL